MNSLMRCWGLAALVAAAIFFSINTNASARGGDDDQTDLIVNLVPSASAPAGATGLAKVEAETEHGTVQPSEFEVEVRGLPAGVYTVNLFNRSGTESFIGTLTVDGSGGTGAIDDSSKRRSRGGDDDDGNEGEAEQHFTIPGEIAINPGLLSITDSNGTAMLTADFANATNAVKARIARRVSIQPGEAAPEASGRAEVKGTVRSGKSKGTFKLEARDVPPNTVFLLAINGAPVGDVRSQKNGRLRIRMSQKNVNVFDIQTVQVVTDTGATVLTATF